MDLRAAGTLGLDAYMDAHRLDAVLFPGATGAAIAAKPGYPSVQVPAGFTAGIGTRSAGLPARRDLHRPRLERADPAAPRLCLRAGKPCPPRSNLGLKSHGCVIVSSIFPTMSLALARFSGITHGSARLLSWGQGLVAIFRTIARHGMTKGAAFFYAVAVGAGANLVLEYLHKPDLTSVVAHETAAPALPPEHAATAPIAPKPEMRAVEPAPTPHPATATPPAAKPLPEPKSVALPQVPALPLPEVTRLPPSKDFPAPALQPAALSPAAATSTLPPANSPADKPADKPVEAMSVPVLPPPAPPAPNLGNPVSLLPPPPDKPAAAETAEAPPPPPVKPGRGTGGLY